MGESVDSKIPPIPPPTISIECTTQTPGTTSIQDTVDATEECSTKNVEASSMTVTSSD